MVSETVDSILVKEGMVEITLLFHSICSITQWCFYQHIMIPYTLNIYDFLLVLRFMEKFGFNLKTRYIKSMYTFNVILTIHIFWST